jgi:hydrogenase expression/formation protein HypE
MNERFVGKPSPRRLEMLLRGQFGAPGGDVIVGPGAGLDAAVVRLGDGRVMAIAEDPIFPAPKLPLDMMGYFTVHIGASDVAVTGVPPRYMTYTLLLPGACPESDARTIITSISETAATLGITIVGGHTGWYDAVVVPTVGGVTVWGFAPESQWISPGGALDGDVVLLTKGPAIEATALLGVLYREKLAGKVSESLLHAACARTKEISVVEDSRLAFHAGGVHAMHDATEGGVLGGLWEMAAASGLHLHADLDALAVPADVEAVAAALHFDPWAAISEGTLLAAVAPDSVREVQSSWSRAGIPSFAIGRFEGRARASSVRRNGHEVELGEPGQDPFWNLFFAGLADGSPA